MRPFVWLKERLFSGELKQRAVWQQGVTWFRLRYQDAAGPQKCILWLSRSHSPGRIGLSYCPGATVNRLYVGIPRAYASLLLQMAQDYHFSLTSEAEMPITPCWQKKLSPVNQLPWERPFLAHIVQGQVFVTEENGRSYFPAPTQPPASIPWSLPTPPPPGITGHITWQDSAVVLPDEDGWPLGKTNSGQMPSAQRVNLYGEPEAVADWLLHQTYFCITETQKTNLVVIDGQGDVVPRLKRHENIVKSMGGQIHYLDLDNRSTSIGFNPLAAGWGEDAEAVVDRWQVWFGGMGCGLAGQKVLGKAWQDRVRHMGQLREWLALPEQQEQQEAYRDLKKCLETLSRSRHIREQLEWPNGCLEDILNKVLLFSCQANGWEQAHLLNAILLAAIQTGADIILHGFPWKFFASPHPIQSYPTLVVSNGPLVSHTTPLLVHHCHRTAELAAQKFFPLAQQEHMGEILQLLRPGESLVATTTPLFTSWRQNGF